MPVNVLRIGIWELSVAPEAAGGYTFKNTAKNTDAQTSDLCTFAQIPRR